ncbi:MAG: hypothetical protein IKQ94_00400 [Bacteroidales bacterium]|nr:hypothetical protein [Bacteroidales bacterium]
MTEFDSIKNGCFEFLLNPKVDNPSFPVKVYSMNVEGIISPSSNTDIAEKDFVRIMYEETCINDSDWFDYGKEYCKIRDNLITYFKHKDDKPKDIFYSPTKDIFYTPTIIYSPDKNKIRNSNAVTPDLTCINMPSQYRKNCGALNRFSYCDHIHTEEWYEIWEIKKMNEYDYNNKCVELSKSNFILLFGKERLCDLKKNVEKIIDEINQPQSPVIHPLVVQAYATNRDLKLSSKSPYRCSFEDLLEKNKIEEGDKKIKEERLKLSPTYEWRMISGDNRIPQIIVLCSNIVLSQEEYNSIMCDVKRKKSFIASIENQKKRQELRNNIKAEEKRKRQQEEERRKRIENERRFNTNNAHNRDKEISYNEEYNTYIVNNQTYDNIRFVIKSLFPRFDTLKQAQEISQLKGISVNDVQNEWKEKSKKTQTTEKKFMEQVEKFYQKGYFDSNPNINLFAGFSNNVHIWPYRTKWSIYDEYLHIAGTIDMVCGSPESLVVYKLTTRDHLVSNGAAIKNNDDGRTALSPIEHLSDTLYYQFSLELGFFKYILEKRYNMNVSELRLGVFNESQVKPYIFRIPYLEKEVISIIDSRNDVIY